MTQTKAIRIGYLVEQLANETNTDFIVLLDCLEGTTFGEEESGQIARSILEINEHGDSIYENNL